MPARLAADSRKSPVRAMNRRMPRAMAGRRKQGAIQMANDKLDLAVSGKAVAFVYVTDRDRALAFYRDTLGLHVRDSDFYGDFLDLPGALLRLTTIPGFEPHPHPVLGFDVEDIEADAAALRGRGVAFDIFEGMGQDENGICAMPDGGKLAFFKDPDGNALMLSQG